MLTGFKLVTWLQKLKPERREKPIAMAAYCIICEVPVHRSQEDLKFLCDGCKIPTEKSSIAERVVEFSKKGENAGDQIERTFQIVERGSKHGNPQLIDSFRYTYHVIRRGVKSTAWQCMVATEGTLCQATVTQWKNGIFTVNRDRPHIHSPAAGALTIARIKSRIRIKVAADLVKPVSLIVRQVLQEELTQRHPAPVSRSAET